MRHNKHIASITLALVSVGFFASYPFQTDFVGGLIANACSAAMIGGLADWFAVSALFRKPLGIPFRTAIIPRNREKLEQIIVNAVEQELLTTANISRTLGQYDVADLIIRYLTEHGGKENVKHIIEQLIKDIVKQLNAHEVSRLLEVLFKDDIKALELSPVLADVLEWSLKNGYIDKVITFTIDEIMRIAAHQHVPHILAEFFIQTQHAYERGMKRRRFFDRVVEQILNLSPRQIGEAAQKKILQVLAGLKDPDHVLRQQLTTRLERLVIQLRSEEGLKQQLEAWKQSYLAQPTFFQQTFTKIISYIKEYTVNNISLTARISHQVDLLVEHVTHSDSERSKLDVSIKKIIINWFDVHHRGIGIMVRERLKQFTNAELVSFIESRAGNDLQMVRINGSVVGGLLGMVIYMVTYFMHI